MKKGKEGSIWFLIIFGAGIALLIYFQVYKKDKLFYLKEALTSNIEQSYNGVIEKKYTDKMNHNSLMVRFTKDNSIGLNGFFWDKVQVGDSISKVKGDSIIQVFRGEKKLYIEIAPFYRRAIKSEIEKRNKH
ncbi:hypothetical protein [Sphingobacterium lactis]|uniref:hypothetical protein n=1 Tax=Sphingobacterium lactis TaxID=797291 RepID=UPI003DA48DD3